MCWRLQVIPSSQPVATADPSRTRSARSHSSSQPVSRSDGSHSLREVISSRIMFLIVIFVLCVVKRLLSLVNIFPIILGNFPYFWEICFPYSFFPFFFPRF